MINDDDAHDVDDNGGGEHVDNDDAKIQRAIRRPNHVKWLHPVWLVLSSSFIFLTSIVFF